MPVIPRVADDRAAAARTRGSDRDGIRVLAYGKLVACTLGLRQQQNPRHLVVATTSTYCRILGTYVTCMTKMGGYRTEVTCPEYDASTGICRLKRQREASASSILFRAVGEGPTAERTRQCELI